MDPVQQVVNPSGALHGVVQEEPKLGNGPDLVTYTSRQCLPDSWPELHETPECRLFLGLVVTEGKIRRNDRVHLIREGVVIYEGTLASLKRFKDDVKEVVSGYECGMGIENFNDVKVDDQIEAYEIVEKKRKLEV